MEPRPGVGLQLSQGADTLSSWGEGSCMGGVGGGGAPRSYWFGSSTHTLRYNLGESSKASDAVLICSLVPAVYRLGVEIIKRRCQCS